MTVSKLPEVEFEHEDFDFTTIEEEVRVDERCQSLLKHFYLHLQGRGLPVQQASDLAYSADYYLRDYLIDFCRQNVMRPQPGLIRRFAGTWFVINTIDPEIKSLERHLEAIQELYRFLHGQHFITADELAFVESEAEQTDYYRQRLDSFNDITGDGYIAWVALCPLRN